MGVDARRPGLQRKPGGTTVASQVLAASSNAFPIPLERRSGATAKSSTQARCPNRTETMSR
jgi:hypothetical protein